VPDKHIEPLDETAARQLDTEIRALARQAHIVIEALYALVNEAKANNIHVALGFPSWTAYIADALDGQWKIEADKRGEVIRYLASQGMSQRAIAAVTGAGKGTVGRELAGAPLGQVITGLDGKTYPRPEPRQGDGEESDDAFLARVVAEQAGGIFTIPATIEEAATRLNVMAEDDIRLERILLGRRAVSAGALLERALQLNAEVEDAQREAIELTRQLNIHLAEGKAEKVHVALGYESWSAFLRYAVKGMIPRDVGVMNKADFIEIFRPTMDSEFFDAVLAEWPQSQAS
jgi:hypothetical protein